MPGVAFTLFSSRQFSENSARAAVDEIMNWPSTIRPSRFGVFQSDREIPDVTSLVDTLLNRETEGKPLRAGMLAMESEFRLRLSLHWGNHPKPRFSVLSGHLESPHLEDVLEPIREVSSALPGLACTLGVAYGEMRAVGPKWWDLPIDLSVRLPDIPNVSIYGRDYVALFGKERIETAPFLEVREICESTYWLRAVESLTDGVPAETRAAIRTHLGEKAFMADGRWRYKDGLAPKVELAS